MLVISVSDLCSNYVLNVCNVHSDLTEHLSESEFVKLCEQIRQMCSWRDRSGLTDLIRRNAVQLLNGYEHVSYFLNVFLKVHIYIVIDLLFNAETYDLGHQNYD